MSRLNDLQTEDDPEQAYDLMKVYNEEIVMLSSTSILSRKSNFIKPWMTEGPLNSINHKSKLGSIKIKQSSTESITKYNKFRNCLNKTNTEAKNCSIRINFLSKYVIQRKLVRLSAYF